MCLFLPEHPAAFSGIAGAAGFLASGLFWQLVISEAGIKMKYGRVCTDETISYVCELEEALPNSRRIVDEALKLM